MKRTKYIAAALCIALFFSGCAKEQDQKKHIFGATYMTRNNPYFDVLNDEIAEELKQTGTNSLSGTAFRTSPNKISRFSI